jgi:hypothetical protein
MKGLKKKDLNKYSKSFMSGAIVPVIGVALIVPIMYVFSVQALILTYLAALPFVWGVWNVIYETSKKPYNIGYQGALLGFILSLFDISVFGIAQLCNLTNGLELLLVFFDPLIYYFVWYYGVEWFNKLVGLR